MTDINDKRSFIYRLQFLLYELARHRDDIKTVFPDGIYGPETAQAVSDFQRSVGLRENGKADIDTWNALQKECRKLRETESAPIPICPFEASPERCVKKGARGSLVKIIQIMLNAVQPFYGSFPRVDEDGVYGDRTAEAISGFRSAVGLEAGDDADKLTWDRLAEQYGHCIKYSEDLKRRH